MPRTPSRGDALAAAGAVVALAAAADLAWTLDDRFGLDFAELTALERTLVALWDLRPLTAAAVALGSLLVLAGLREGGARPQGLHEAARFLVAALAAALAALAVLVVGAACWVAATGAVGRPEELGFVYTGRERAVTLATQTVAWIPLGVLLLLAARALARTVPVPDGEAAPDPISTITDEMEELWRERLAYSPSREHARLLLGRIRALERAGDEDEARRLAEEMRRL